jgi:ubiquitin-conjugating enzyme E2 O
VLNDKPYFNEPGNKSTANTPPGEKHSVAYNQTAFVLSCKTMLYSLRKPPKVSIELSFLANVKMIPWFLFMP